MSNRDGVTLIEAIVVIVIIMIGSFVLLMTLPQGREQARLLGCRKNLGQIGVALALFDQSHQQTPTVLAVAGPDLPAAIKRPSPLFALLETLDVPDLTGLHDRQSTPPARADHRPAEVPVPGFVCASDPNATLGIFAAPISYRSTTGDTPAGENGPFATGRSFRLQQIDDIDGLSFTAAFSERLVGDGFTDHPSIANYQVVAGPLSGSGCRAENAGARWRGDAGASWMWADLRYTLYNHSLPPGAQPSGVAGDGQTAFMGASSGHPRGVNLLLMDGSVTLVTREIDLRVWQQFATIKHK
jgi:hypothetical protein